MAKIIEGSLDSRDNTKTPPAYLDPVSLHQMMRIRRAQIAIKFGKLIAKAMKESHGKDSNRPTDVGPEGVQTRDGVPE